MHHNRLRSKATFASEHVVVCSRGVSVPTHRIIRSVATVVPSARPPLAVGVNSKPTAATEPAPKASAAVASSPVAIVSASGLNGPPRQCPALVARAIRSASSATFSAASGRGAMCASFAHRVLRSNDSVVSPAVRLYGVCDCANAAGDESWVGSYPRRGMFQRTDDGTAYRVTHIGHCYDTAYSHAHERIPPRRVPATGAREEA